MNDSRRRYARLFFDSPVEAKLGGHRISLLDFGRTGAGAEHTVPFSTGRSGTLEVALAGVRVKIKAEIVRCRLVRRTSTGTLIYRSGLVFGSEGHESVIDAVAALVHRQRQEAFAAAHPESLERLKLGPLR